MTEIPTGNAYDKYASGNPIERRLMNGFWRAFDKSLPDKASRILEVGIGEGEVMERLQSHFPKAKVSGIDLIDPELQNQWSERDLAASVADATNLPFADNTFDLVLAIEVLEHVDAPIAMLAEINRVCTGSVVLSVPQEPLWRVANMARGAYWKNLGNTPGHINHWSRSSFQELVADHFTVESVASPPPWTVVEARVMSTS